jgi:membrane associated rhomboid family serine protease
VLAVGVAMTEEALEADRIKVYSPRSGAQFRAGFILIGLGLLLGFLGLRSVLNWFSGGPVPNTQAFLSLVVLLLVPIGVLAIFNALRGLPRLIVNSHGIAIKFGFGTKWANWDSLEPFTIKTIYAGRFRKPLLTGSANVIGDHASKAVLRAKTFSVPDQFQSPINSVLDELNAARSHIVGGREFIPTAVPEEAPVGLAEFKLPWLTFALLTILVAVFAMENLFAVTPSVRSHPSIATLFAMGALSSKAILSGGQWYRLFTAPLLHASIPHILGNGLALVLGGWLLERLVGRLWFFALFVISALGGSLVSLAVTPSNLISVGASGALMGLFAALFIGSFRVPAGTPARTKLQVNSLRTLIPSLLPLFSSNSVIHIDYGAHFGGALSGAVVAAFLLKFWPETERIPQLRKVAAATSIVGAILFVASACIVIANYPTYRAAASRPLPAIIPRQNPFSSAQPNPLPQPDSSTLEPQSNVVLDHGPGRAACDLQWSRSSEKSADSYPDFLRNCMKKYRQ